MNFTHWKTVPERNEVSISIELFASQTMQLAEGRRRTVVIFGGPGCGKTFTANKALKQFRARGLMPIHANPEDFRALLKTFDESQAGSGGRLSRVRPIFFDEADTIFNSEKCLNILKVAFSVEQSERVYDSQMLNAPVIISTNKNLHDFTPAKREHINAIKDRVPPIHVPREAYESWEHAIYLALTTPMLRRTQMGRTIALETQIRAMEWFTDHIRYLTVVGPRALRAAVEIMSMGSRPHLEARELQTMLSGKTQEMPRSAEQQDWRGLIADFHNASKQKENKV